ncbi:MAG: DUF1489 domain-containing protein [Paracoccaceae bacterium]|nr:DUF1489 domain-containing protein [Paracoccaceae bacterium]
MDNSLHLIKLSVGSEDMKSLARWQASKAAKGPDGLPRHVTRMWPKRESDLLKNGSIYWVIKGVVLCRQRILRLDEVIGGDGIRRCAIVLDPELHRVEAMPKRPFQGWRYLEGKDAPRDLGKDSANDDLPPKLVMALSEVGIR